MRLTAVMGTHARIIHRMQVAGIGMMAHPPQGTGRAEIATHTIFKRERAGRSALAQPAARSERWGVVVALGGHTATGQR